MITIRSLKFGKHRLVYRTCGEGPDVVMIHGWLSSSRMWDETMRCLAPHYRVWAIDLLGFGDSRTTEDMPLTVDRHVDLIVTFCQQLGLHPYAVVGHSMGGSIAIKLALDYPTLMQRLVLVCPVVTGNLHFNVGTLIGKAATQRLMAVGEKWWPALQTMPGSNLFVAPPYLNSDAIRRSIEDFRRATWQATYNGLTSLATIRLDRFLHQIAISTLVVTGSQDLTVPPSDSRLAAKIIPDSTLLEYSNCHHQPTDEETEHFNRTLRDFLDAGLGQSADVDERADQSA
ncbi:MAG: alpha/beta hydrolase [Anaerolineae bacterium]|nr:alpha/beta hydrolase [Anaerolineae bacterium]